MSFKTAFDRLTKPIVKFLDAHSWICWILCILGIPLFVIIVLFLIAFIMPLEMIDKIVDDIQRLDEDKKPVVRRVWKVIQTLIAVVLVTWGIIYNFVLPYIEDDVAPSPTISIEYTAEPTPARNNNSSSSSGGSVIPNRIRNADDIKSDPLTIVYITESGIKYHKSGCQYLSSSCIPITLYDAVDQGYDVCSRCDPPE